MPSLTVEMSDVFSKAKRSDVMSKIRGRGNKNAELALIRFFRRHRITGWRRNQKVFGKPDFIFSQARVAIFVDGCFWHGCPRHGTSPKSNQKYWKQKFSANEQRDRLVNRTLKRDGWRVIRIWEHELRQKDMGKLWRLISRALE